ncbi:MAG: hypothetical protein JWM68_1792 [Verrucomicrobiales bacterium]|nr:hypothetical protein [Verrucomicrobiales bacterium]
MERAHFGQTFAMQESMNYKKPSARLCLHFLCFIFVTLGSAPCAYSDALDHWTATQVSTNAFQLSDVIYGGGLYVAAGGAGDGGTILTSQDGASWIVRADGRSSGHSPSLVWALAYGGGRFVAAGHFGGTASSTNGIDWSYGSATTLGLKGVAYGAGKFAAVGGSQGESPGPDVFTSTDGTNWTRQTISPSETRDFFDVAYGAGKFVATAAGGYTYTSTDGALWTRSATTIAGTRITFCHGLFFVSSSPGTNLLSRDGINWTSVNTGVTNLLGKPIYTAGLYVARTRNDFAVSSDGTNWIQRTLAAQPSGSEVTYLATMATDGRRFVSVGATNVGIFQYNAFIYRSDPPVGVKMKDGPSTEIVLSGLTGLNYRVEWTASLPLSETNNWQLLTNVTLSGTSQSVYDPAKSPQRYYRAILLP